MEPTNQPIEHLAEPQAAPPEYAGFILRLVAYIIDALILSFVLGIIFAALALIMGLSFAGLAEMDEQAAPLVMIPFIATASLGSLVVVWLYYALMESGKNQGTIGKMLLNIKVTDEKGGPISFGRATGRYFGKIISGAILYIGYIMIAFTEKQQGLHDMIAGCLVVKK